MPVPRRKASRPASRIESSVSMSPTATATMATVVTVEKRRWRRLRRMMVKSFTGDR